MLRTTATGTVTLRNFSVKVSEARIEPHSRFLLAQAQRFARFGNGAKKTCLGRCAHRPCRCQMCTVTVYALKPARPSTEAPLAYLNQIPFSSIDDVVADKKRALPKPAVPLTEGRA